MEQLHNGFTLEISPGAFPLSTDSMVLAGFVRLPKNAQVLDLGSGCGTLGLLLCANDPGCSITGVEIDENAHRTALENADRNGISNRLTSICGDIKDISSFITAGSFSCCVSNPPYFSGGPQSSSVPTARRDDLCSMAALIGAAAWALRYGGDFFLVHRPERLAEIFSCACTHKLEPKRLLLLRHKPEDPVSLVLVQCRKGGKPGLVWEEQALYTASYEPSEFYRHIYHL